jgi:hypothetical protein
MNKLQKHKLDCLIHILSVEHQKTSGKVLYKTSLFKYIDLFEFEILKETGVPPLRLKYRALENGPVPVYLNSQFSQSNYKSEYVKIETEEIQNSERIKIIPITNEYNLEYFSDYEIDKIYSLIDTYAKNYKDNNELIEATHKIHACAHGKKPGKNEKIPLNLPKI